MNLNKRGEKQKIQASTIDTQSFIRYVPNNRNHKLEEHLTRKKSKLPPILQCRKIFLQHLQTEQSNRIDELTKEFNDLKCYPTERNQVDVNTQKFSELQRNISPVLIPRLGKLIIDRDHPRKPRRECMVSYSAAQLDRYQQLSKQKQQNIQAQKFQKFSIRNKNRPEQIHRQYQNSLIKFIQKMKIRYKVSEQVVIKSFTHKINIGPKQNKAIGLSISRLDTIHTNKDEKTNYTERGIKMQQIKIKNKDKPKSVCKIKYLNLHERESMNGSEQLQPWSQQDNNYLLCCRVYQK